MSKPGCIYRQCYGSRPRAGLAQCSPGVLPHRPVSSMNPGGHGFYYSQSKSMSINFKKKGAGQGVCMCVCVCVEVVFSSPSPPLSLCFIYSLLGFLSRSPFGCQRVLCPETVVLRSLLCPKFSMSSRIITSCRFDSFSLWRLLYVYDFVWLSA